MLNKHKCQQLPAVAMLVPLSSHGLACGAADVLLEPVWQCSTISIRMLSELRFDVLMKNGGAGCMHDDGRAVEHVHPRAVLAACVLGSSRGVASLCLCQVELLAAAVDICKSLQHVTAAG